MSLTLLERTRALLSTASIAMSFWIKIIRIAYYAINWSPSTTTEFKTFIEMCTSKLVNYSFLYIFIALHM